MGGQARCPLHPGPPGSRPGLPWPAVVRGARVRPVLGAGRRARPAGRHALQRQWLLPVHLRMGRRRAGDAAVPNQCDGHPQRVAADPGRGGVVGDPRRALPPSQAEGRDRRGRFEVDDPIARRPGRGIQEGPGGFPERPRRDGQEPHPRQPVLRGRHRRSGQPCRCGSSACTARTGRTRKGWRSRRSTSTRCRTCPSTTRQRSWAATCPASSRCDRTTFRGRPSPRWS